MDKIKGKVKIVKNYRDEILDKILQYIENQYTIDNIILASDLNKEIISSSIRQFFIQHELYDIYGIVN